MEIFEAYWIAKMHIDLYLLKVGHKSYPYFVSIVNFKYLNNDINFNVSLIIIDKFHICINIICICWIYYTHIPTVHVLYSKLVINWKSLSGVRVLLYFWILIFGLLCLQNIPLCIIFEETTKLKIVTFVKELSSQYLVTLSILHGWYIYNAVIQIHVAFQIFSENMRSYIVD